MKIITGLLLLITLFVILISGGLMIYRFTLLSQGKLTGEEVFGKEQWYKIRRK